MLILKLLQLFILYIYLNIAETFEVSSINKSKEKLSTSLLNILCSTDSNTIRLLVVDGIFDETDEFIARLNNECPFKTVQLSTINAITTKSVHRHSEVIVFMLDSNDSIHDFEQAVTKFQDSDNHKRFVVLSRFQYDLRMLANVFRTLARQTVFNIVVVMHPDDLEEIILQYNPFDGTTQIVGSALKLERRELFMRNQSDLYGRKVVISMHEQFDRAISNKNGTTGYTGVDGLVADLLEERMNLKFQYTTPSEMFNGNRNSGVIGDLTVGHAEMSFNADSLTQLLVDDAVDSTEPFERNDMSILVPKAGNEPIIWNLLRTMSKWTWVITLISIVAMMLFYWCVQFIHKSIYPRKYPFYEL